MAYGSSLEEHMSMYAHPEMLVNTQWVADHGRDANVRLIELGFDLTAYHSGHIVVVDLRSADMYRGDNLFGLPAGGHIPGAVNVPAEMILEGDTFKEWRMPTTNDDGTFKSLEELRALFTDKGVTPDKEVITYCVRAGLSSHAWFVLKELLGYPHVREYDGSW